MNFRHLYFQERTLLKEASVFTSNQKESVVSQETSISTEQLISVFLVNHEIHSQILRGKLSTIKDLWL